MKDTKDTPSRAFKEELLQHLTPLDKEHLLPLHEQGAEQIRSLIQKKVLLPKMKIPSEKFLGDAWNVARSVVRQTLIRLMFEGVITREHGFSAVIAPPPQRHRLVQSTTGLFQQCAQHGVNLSSAVLRFEPAEAPREVQDFLRTKQTILLERVRSIDGQKIAFVRTWLNGEIFTGIHLHNLTDKSLHSLFENKYQRTPTRGKNLIRALNADRMLAYHLELKPGAAVLCLQGSAVDQSEAPIEWFESYHSSEHFVFEVDVSAEWERVTPTMRETEIPTVHIAPESVTPDVNYEAGILLRENLQNAMLQLSRMMKKNP